MILLRHNGLRAIVSVILLAMTGFVPGCSRAPEGQWYKGNTHCHSLWSDGDAAPEVVVDFYTSHGYDFLVLSDHNVLLRGEKWFPITENTGRLTRARVDELTREYGPEWVVEEVRDGRPMMRLKTFAELQARFDRPGEFIMIEGEEITDSAEGEPVHLNVFPASELVEPQHGETIVAALRSNLAAGNGLEPVEGAEPLVHVNHPNFSWAFSWPELLESGCRYFELYNGHSRVYSDGDDEHISCEEMWDHVLVRQTAGAAPGEPVALLYGVGTDDTHNYYTDDPDRAVPGRAWIRVRADALTPVALRESYENGDFYASTGVELSDLRVTRRKMSITVAAEEGVTYTVRFIGARPADDGEPTAIILQETVSSAAEYRFDGDELYVRATILSTRLHPLPNTPGEVERAWIQPVRPGR